MNQWAVEYYSNDNNEWLKCSVTFYCLDDAVGSMREQAKNDPDLAHRIVRSVIHRTTVAMLTYGDEMICR